jgi:hypothetical protein
VKFATFLPVVPEMGGVMRPSTKPIGRPRQRWQEDVMEDLKRLEVKNWKETAKDRRSWRDLTEKAKTHKGL